MCELIFLGTGGGRVNLLEQIRKTGGFLIKSKNLLISVDPGPSALSQLHSLKINHHSVDCVIVTHAHIDHVLEAPLLIEAMSGCMLKKGGVLISSKHTVLGDENGDRSITLYHQSKLEQNLVFCAGQTLQIQIPSKGSFKIHGVKVKHDDESGFGFVIEINGYKIGYTSDTEYIPTVHDKAYSGVDLLIANCLKPSEDEIPGHLHSGTTALLFSNSKPKTGVISHLGMKLIRAGPEEEAAKIESKSKVRTIAARDGYFYDLKSSKWAKYPLKKEPEKKQTKL